ncbi:hypothetical protein ACFVIY_18875 [Streptomyces sp. NPDC127166]|uniref:hypothetical protein n=1 Tax=Streptomyces sp. NPDC127166 TaxID=3345380 RepID=UPI00363295C3
MTFYPRDGQRVPEIHDMTTDGQGSNSRLNTARMQGDSTENADRLIRERRAAAATAVSHNDKMQRHYAEMAAVHDAEQRELEDFRAQQKADAERRKRDELHGRWEAEEGQYIAIDRHSDPLEALAETRQSLAEFKQRAEGDELAARIFNRIHAPWL